MKNQNRYVATRIFNHYFVYLWIVTFTLQCGQNIYNSVLSVYVLGLGFSNAFAGALFIPFLVCAIVGRTISGFVSDDRSRRLALCMGVAAFLLGCIIFDIPVIAGSPIFMMAARGAHGFGYAAGNTAYSVAAVDCAPKKKTGLAIGINWTAQGFAQAIVGVLISVIVVNGDYKPLFYISTAALVIAEIFSILCDYEGKPAERPKHEKRTIRAIANGMFELSALPYAAIALIYYGGVSSVSMFALAAAEERGIPSSGYFFTTCSVGMVACNLLIVRLQSRFGSRKALVPVYILMALCPVILSFSADTGSFLTAGVLYGIGLGAMPAIQNETVRNLPVFRRGAGTSTLFLAMDLANGLGPVIWGAVIDATDYRITFIASAVCVLVAMLLVIIVFGRNRNIEPEIR